MIAASDSAGKASARTSARASDKSADNSAFAILLAGTAQQPPQKQSPAPASKDDAAPAKPPVEAADTRNDSDQTKSAPAAQTASSALDVKRDKKSGKDDNGQTGDGDAPQAQTPDPAAPVLVAAIPPSQQTIPQTFDIAAAASDSDADKTAPADTISKADPADLPTGTQPVKDAAPASTPAAIPAANDEIDLTRSAPVTASLDPIIPPDDSKPVTDKPAKPAIDQAQPAETPTPAPAADAAVMVQAAMAAPALSAATSTTGTAASDTAPAIQIAGIAASATDKSSANTASPASRPSQPAAADSKSTAMPGPESLPATASPVAVAHTDMAKDNGPAKSDDDAKPVHVADAQAETPLPQPMPAPSLPHAAPNAFGNAFGIAPPLAAANSPAVTSSVQITAANTEAVPDLDALAVSVAARAMSGSKQFEIRLDPPELGRVDVRLSIDASGKTQAHMTADQPQTLDLLQKDATNLTQALRDAGLDVSQGGLNFSLRGQDRQSGDGNNGAGQSRRTNLIASRAIQSVQSPGAISFNGAAQNARVDIHV